MVGKFYNLLSWCRMCITLNLYITVKYARPPLILFFTRVTYLPAHIYPPPSTKFVGFIGITLSISLSVCLSHLSDQDNISNNCCPWPKCVSWPYPISRSQCIYTENPCPGHNSSLLSWIWIIFHTIVVNDPRMCHDFYPRSYIQGQGFSAHILEIRVRAITPHCLVGFG